jgi:hypothetical protein
MFSKIVAHTLPRLPPFPFARPKPRDPEHEKLVASLETLSRQPELIGYALKRLYGTVWIDVTASSDSIRQSELLKCLTEIDSCLRIITLEFAACQEE